MLKKLVYPSTWDLHKRKIILLLLQTFKIFS